MLKLAKWGDYVALIEPSAGAKEGLVVDIDSAGRNVSVENKDGLYVGGSQWMPVTAFYVMRESCG